MHVRSIFAAATIAVAALGLAACSGPGAGTGKNGELTWEDSPLNKYLSAGYDSGISDEDRQAEFDKQNAKVEDVVAACMAKEGFEYRPNTNNSGVVYSDEDNPWKPDDRKWVEEYGYGMLKSPWQEQSGEEVSEDPNQKYVEGLSESERASYYETLYGGEPDPEDVNEDGSYTLTWEQSGCQGSAQHEVYGDDASDLLSEQYQDLFDAMNDMYTKQWDSALAVDKKWSACMEEGGYPGMERQSAAQEAFSDKLNKMYENADPEKGPDTNSEEYKSLQKDEIKQALVDLDCREKVDYAQEQLKEQFAAEEEFIAEHKAELDEYKKAAEQAAKKS
ncbi:hypothetical protein [Microbacterium gorillae]|uniref:hypothetical protein n=1 Tax=Microbacterium gorillae TaxID=1231063 RepID=UPI00058C0393|nr:hypothetical protein [Microbacterium gorillae]